MFSLLAAASLVLGAPGVVLPAGPVSSSVDGHLALVHGVLTGPNSGDLTVAARAFVQQRRAELGLPATSSLGVAKTFSTRFGGSVHLPQQVGGIDVQGGKVIVTFDLQGRVVRVASSLKRYEVAKLGWNLSPAQALVVGAGEIDGAALEADGAPYGGTSQRLFLVGNELHAGYLVWVPTLKTSENWHLGIDATDGAVLFTDNRVDHGFEAAVYASSPGGLSAGVGVTPVASVELGRFPAGVDGGFLNGDQIRAFNCCPTLGCAQDAGSRRATGQFQTFGGGVITYDLAICDRVQRVTNDPAINPNGNYVYTPVDPPTGSSPNLQSLADYDEFAEVHAYFHVNKTYDLLRTLSEGPLTADAGFALFQMRDKKVGKVPAIWVNASEPSFPQSANAQGVYVGDTMSRVDNAMFLPRESMQAVSVPEFAFDTDALVIYQGAKADFAYDAPVVWHEFGHGAIYSTANWDRGVAEIDSRSANDESSALHEGVADVIAFMVGNESAIGTYVGPRTDFATAALRDANNTYRCPEVLWGESHQDSMHFSGAIWQARSTTFQDADQGRTFDAAFYAAMVSFPADVGFEKAAAIISASVGLAFPGIPDAQGKMKAIFDSRGVSNCSKVLDVTGDTAGRAVYIIPGTQLAGLQPGQGVPGPYQMKIQAPKGAKGVTVSGPYFGSTVRIQLLAKANAPITFVRSGLTLSHNANFQVVPTATNGRMSGTAPLQVPCGGEIYFTLTNTSGRDRQLSDLRYTFEEADSCEVPDAGSPDAGVEPVDAGPPMDLTVEGAPNPLGPAAKGCGCSTGSPVAMVWPVLLFGLLGTTKRRPFRTAASRD